LLYKLKSLLFTRVPFSMLVHIQRGSICNVIRR